MTVVARFQFHPEDAAYFVEDGSEFIEMQFDNAEEVIEYCQEFEAALVDVIALINGRVVSLSDQPEE